MKEQRFDICRSGWFTDYADPTGFLMMFHSEDGNNDGKFSVLRFDELLGKTRKETDRVRRYELIRRAERILVEEEVGVIPLIQYVGNYMYRDNVGGIWQNPKQMILLKYVHRE
jgi:oligopeptide transport system substrate-binding protein